ncbi:hypothetical protein FOCC_FOCC007300 [Frankliniella occidentalis]|nr:hypothetical protein FOCC_FOCC007300 [Frankliniella occidentalis]
MEDAGYLVDGVVTDGAPWNQAMWKMFGTVHFPKKVDKRQSRPASFKKKVMIRADQTSNRAAARDFGVNESMIRKWKGQTVALSKCNRDRRKFSGPKRGRHPGLEEDLSEFVRKKRGNALPVTITIPMLQEEALRLARTTYGLNRLRFKARYGKIQNFMRRQGFFLRRRISI